MVRLLINAFIGSIILSLVCTIPFAILTDGIKIRSLEVFSMVALQKDFISGMREPL
jgi:hypothetical protein